MAIKNLTILLVVLLLSSCVMWESGHKCVYRFSSDFEEGKMIEYENALNKSEQFRTYVNSFYKKRDKVSVDLYLLQELDSTHLIYFSHNYLNNKKRNKTPVFSEGCTKYKVLMISGDQVIVQNDSLAGAFNRLNIDTEMLNIAGGSVCK